jgi:hypothetical protein
MFVGVNGISEIESHPPCYVFHSLVHKIVLVSYLWLNRTGDINAFVIEM